MKDIIIKILIVLGVIVGIGVFILINLGDLNRWLYLKNNPQDCTWSDHEVGLC